MYENSFIEGVDLVGFEMPLLKYGIYHILL